MINQTINHQLGNSLTSLYEEIIKVKSTQFGYCADEYSYTNNYFTWLWIGNDERIDTIITILKCEL